MVARRHQSMSLILALLLQHKATTADEKDRTVFLTMAVVEGLYVDGANPETVRLLAQDKWQIFVPKCPICMPVRHAFEIAAAAPPPDMYDSRGNGLPAEIEAQLNAKELPTRKKGLEALVKRYVERRFALVKMTDVEQARMRRLLEEGRKSGTSMMNPAPGDFCPSCDGAGKPR